MKLYLIFSFSFIWLCSQGQNRTNVWELSYSTNILYPNSELIFQSSNVDTHSVERVMSMFDTNTSICDTNGNLLFYTNGLTIGNRIYDTLQNAVDFNPGWATTFYEPKGLATSQGALFIPFPGKDNLYYLFHLTGESFFANSQSEVQPLHLSYSIIDINLDSGMGGIVEGFKNVHIIEDTLTWGRITACKHANGVSWWIIMHRYYSDKYYKLLITSDSIFGPYGQLIGSVITKDIFGQASFSPDGSKYAMVSQVNVLDYMNFDRCSGEFFNSQTIFVADSTGIVGCSFSPSGRFLYVSSKYDLFQYDTWNPNMANDVLHIASWDGFSEGSVPVLFFMHQLASNGKIYLGPFNGVSYLNVINQPDSLGTLCEFVPHSIVLPQYNVNVPSFPNYDLGPLSGGDTCNIVYTTQNMSSQKVSIYRIAPNPVSDWLNLIYQSNEDALFELFDLYGKRVGAISLFSYFKNRLLNVSNLPPGVYLAIITSNGEKVWSEKVVVQR
jgi:hypothetical protein